MVDGRKKRRKRQSSQPKSDRLLNSSKGRLRPELRGGGESPEGGVSAKKGPHRMMRPFVRAPEEGLEAAGQREHDCDVEGEDCLNMRPQPPT